MPTTQATPPFYRPGASILRRLTMLLSLLALLIASSGCHEQGTRLGVAPTVKSDEGRAQPSNKVLTAKQILQKGGLCTDNRTVDEAEEGTQEWVILRMYELALGPGNDASFKAFRALFPEARNTRQLKEMYWPRVRKNVQKYMNEPGKPGFTICRTIATDRGRKYYIKSNDPRQHPPPIEIGEDDGEMKILALTPF